MKKMEEKMAGKQKPRAGALLAVKNGRQAFHEELYMKIIKIEKALM